MIKSVMKWWSKCISISMVIAKTASSLPSSLVETLPSRRLSWANLRL